MKKTSQKPPSASKKALSLSSSSSCNGPPVSSSSSFSSTWPPLSYFSPTDFSEFDQWEYVENYDDDCVVDHVFGAVPSPHEVEHAIFSLQQVIHPISPRLNNLDQMHFDIDKDASNVMEKASSTSSESDWIEPSMLIYDQRFPLSRGFNRVYDALNLLQTEPSVQKMVVSLSSDKAVWDAVLNNEAVREIRESYHNAQPNPRIPDENSDNADPNPNVLKWMFDNVKWKLLEVIGAISQSLGEIFKQLDQDKTEQSDTFSEKLKSTFLLTIVILLIVVIARGHKA